MSLIERLRANDLTTQALAADEAADRIEELEAHYERIKSQTCLCRFNKDEGEGEPSTTPSIECEYHRGLRAENERLTAEVSELRAERDQFHMGYRVKCDEETKAAHAENERLRAALNAKALDAAKTLAEWVGDAIDDKSEWKCLRDDLADFIGKYDLNRH